MEYCEFRSGFFSALATPSYHELNRDLLRDTHVTFVRCREFLEARVSISVQHILFENKEVTMDVALYMIA